MRIIFAGTPELAKIVLTKMIDSGYKVDLVLSKPDKPARRGMKLTQSPVTQLAKNYDISLYQPDSLRKNAECIEKLRNLNPDIMIVVAYGLIIPAEILSIPRYGCINVHLSLLPRWRGAAPIHRAILAGDKVSGVTIMQMDQGLDTGDILMIDEVSIAEKETTGTLHDKLAILGANMLVKFLQDPEYYSRQKQPDNGITYAHKITKAEAVIDWSEHAELIERKIRGYNPVPGAISYLGCNLHKFWQADALPNYSHDNIPGTILESGHDQLIIACGGGSALAVKEIQLSGAKRQNVIQYINGNDNLSGKQFIGWMNNVN